MSEEQQKQEETTQLETTGETKPTEVPPEALELCSDPEKIIKEINELNNSYKMLMAQKYHIIGQLQKVEEAIQECMGAYQALKKLYTSAVQAKEKSNV